MFLDNFGYISHLFKVLFQNYDEILLNIFPHFFGENQYIHFLLIVIFKVYSEHQYRFKDQLFLLFFYCIIFNICFF
jgi:hypothetical protein